MAGRRGRASCFPLDPVSGGIPHCVCSTMDTWKTDKALLFDDHKSGYYSYFTVFSLEHKMAKLSRWMTNVNVKHEFVLALKMCHQKGQKVLQSHYIPLFSERAQMNVNQANNVKVITCPNKQTTKIK